MRNEPKPATYLAAVLMHEANEYWTDGMSNCSPYRAASNAEKLVALGKRAARIAIQRCNGIERYDATARRVLASWTEADDERAEKAEARILSEATAILQPYGVTIVKVGGDPRGFCLTFQLLSGRSNSFGGDMWGV